jgi:hypothetical protein
VTRDYGPIIEQAREYAASGEPLYSRSLIRELISVVETLVRENERLRPKRIRSTSRKRAKTLREAKPARDAYREAHPYCEIPGCGRRTQDIHEIVSRARGGSLTDPENLLAVCRPDHDAITTNPAWATERGWLRSKAVTE